MDVREYLARYESLKKAIVRDEKLLLILEGNSEFSLLEKLNDGSFSAGASEEISRVVFDTESLRKKLAAKNRLYEKYALKLARAVNMIEKRPLRDYIVNHYLYGFSNEQVAEMNHYCERQIYRQAQEARRALYLALLVLKPKLIRFTGRRYHVTRHLQKHQSFRRKRFTGVFRPKLNFINVQNQ